HLRYGPAAPAQPRAIGGHGAERVAEDVAQQGGLLLRRRRLRAVGPHRAGAHGGGGLGRHARVARAEGGPAAAGGGEPAGGGGGEVGGAGGRGEVVVDAQHAGERLGLRLVGRFHLLLADLAIGVALGERHGLAGALVGDQGQDEPAAGGGEQAQAALALFEAV